jgi:hypothetical protein
MERLTRKLGDNLYVVDEAMIKHDQNGYSGEAIYKLAMLEDMYDKLKAKEKEIAEEMENLRIDGRMHTDRFRHLEGVKITTNTMKMLFDVYWRDK